MTRSYPDHVDEALIEELVRAFYTKVRADAVLGPIFAEKIGDDWEPHLQTMFAFWSQMMLKTGRYNGRPMPKHLALRSQVQPSDFDIWLTLFRETAFVIAGPDLAPHFIVRAERVAESLKGAMFFDPATIAPRG